MDIFFSMTTGLALMMEFTQVHVCLEILSKQSQSSENFFARFPDSINTPELKLPIDELQKFSFIEKLSAYANFSGGILIGSMDYAWNFKTVGD